MIKAIETRYKGYRFRSRLEARWAVFFDALNLDWEYEMEGFEFGKGIRYLPDFYLPQVRMYAEAKPDKFTFTEYKKAILLVRETHHELLMLIGTPDNHPYWAICIGDYNKHHGGKDGRACLVDYCLTNYHDYPVSEHRFYCSPGDEGKWDDTQKAAEIARSARFEYGESGDDPCFP